MDDRPLPSDRTPSPSNNLLSQTEWRAFLAAPGWNTSSPGGRYDGVRFLIDLGRDVPAYRHKAGAACLLGLFDHAMVRAIEACADQAQEPEATLAKEAAGALRSLLPPEGIAPSPVRAQTAGERRGVLDVIDHLDTAILALEAGEAHTAAEGLERLAGAESDYVVPLPLDAKAAAQEALHLLQPSPSLAADHLRRIRNALERTA